MKKDDSKFRRAGKKKLNKSHDLLMKIVILSKNTLELGLGAKEKAKPKADKNSSQKSDKDKGSKGNPQQREGQATKGEKKSKEVTCIVCDGDHKVKDCPVVPPEKNTGRDKYI